MEDLIKHLKKNKVFFQHCINCGGLLDGTKEILNIIHLPEILILKINRIAPRGLKNKIMINSPINLENTNYELFAINIELGFFLKRIFLSS